MVIEIQFRTHLQHVWATAVETMGLFTQQANYALIDCTLTQAAPQSHMAEIYDAVNLTDTQENPVTLSFEDDGWGNAGTLILDFNKNEITCKIQDLHYTGTDGGAGWGFANGMSLDEMINVLEKDHNLKGIGRKTVSLARHKLIHAMSLMPTPTLSGVIQVDETFFRESQKGTRTDKGKKLINVIPKQLSKRLPRKGYSPSRMGVLSPEYACVVCAVDDKNRAVSVVTSMGKADQKMYVFSP